MLVLSRKVGQRIVLPSLGVTIQIVKLQGDKVRVGVEAPEKAPVHREEVWQSIRDTPSES